MICYHCYECGKLVWFWDDEAKVTFTLKNGKKKVVRFCITCGTRIAERAAGLEN